MTNDPASPAIVAAVPGTEAETASPSKGNLVTETLPYDGGRQVTVYVPPTPPEAIIYTGDGHLIPQWAAANAASAIPTMLVGTHRHPDELQRLHEYSPTLNPATFAAHEHFFMADVRDWVHARFFHASAPPPAARTVVFGVSAGAELALALGLRHPHVFRAVLCASPGAGFRPPAAMPQALPRTYLVAGTLEPFFRENAMRWAEALREAGAETVMVERVGEHGGAFWREEFPLMAAWAFGAQPRGG